MSICTVGFARPAPVKGAANEGDVSAKAPAIAAVPRASFNFMLFSSREYVQPLAPAIGVRSMALQVLQEVIKAHNSFCQSWEHGWRLFASLHSGRCPDHSERVSQGRSGIVFSARAMSGYGPGADIPDHRALHGLALRHV